MTATSTPTSTHAIWLSDLHLDKSTTVQAACFLKELGTTTSDCICITGDISRASMLQEHLCEIAEACWPRPVYFVPGNHDYYGGSIAEVEADTKRTCTKHKNLRHLNGRQIIPLSLSTCIIGHGGWADGRAGHYERGYTRNPDHWAIEDFSGLSHRKALEKMRDLGADSTRAIRQQLPLALSRFRHVLVLTHIPPFPEAVQYDGRACDSHLLPHYVNLSAGMAIQGIARAFPSRQITVLAGHTHSACVARVAPNVTIRVAASRTGSPRIGDLLSFR